MWGRGQVGSLREEGEDNREQNLGLVASTCPCLGQAGRAPLTAPALAPSLCRLQECGLLRKGSVLLADNVIVPGAPDFLAHVRGSSSFECTHYSSFLEYMPVVDGLEKAIYLGPGRPN